MAYDEALADRIRELISVRPNVSEKKMFGSLCFLVGGNLAVCARKVGSSWQRTAISGDQRLTEWVEAGADYAASLPSK
jgi:hypothetical protein